MITIALSKNQVLDADQNAIQQISFTGNPNGNINRLILWIIEKTKKLF